MDRVDTEGFTAQVASISALADPIRRDLYDYVVSQVDPVSRAQAAQATGVAEHTAKFHLDKLVDQGLLSIEFRRLTGRTGPGAGRPAKLYRRSERQVDLTLPRRRYELAGQILAEAVDTAASEGTPVLQSVHAVARRAGQNLADELPHHEPADEARDTLDDVADALADHGYEPRRESDRVILGNCPFHALVDKHPELVCTMNLALLDGFLARCGCQHVQARLDPQPGRCCVTIEREADKPTR